MFTFFPFVCSLLLVATTVLASPVPGTSAITVTTPLGMAQGIQGPSGAYKFPVKYGSAQRWAASSVATAWQLPNGATNASAAPLVCPQPNVDASSMSEDCLSMILYVPETIRAGNNVPIMMWIHGGSFIAGSATAPGLDGSKLATATGSIVAVVQYRLGALGFLGPDGSTNLGLKDIVTALQFLQKVSTSFGGASSKITLAGQSSGANMIRALLAVPSAQSLFQSAIIQSDPINYGFLSTSLQQELQAYFNSGVNATDTSCLNNLSLDSIINAQQDLYDNFYYNNNMAVGQGEPIRVVHDGSFITSTLDSTSPFPKVSKPVLISTVQNEAGLAIYGGMPSALPEGQLQSVVNGTFGSPRAQQLMSSRKYAAPAGSGKQITDARAQLEQIGTDYVWKCASWTFTRNYVQNGGNVYVGMYVVGATYAGNDQVPYCTQNGIVCHQDDIEIVFGTVPSPTAAQSKLTTEMQARYKSFLAEGNPNPSGYPAWAPATTTDVRALSLGGSGRVAVGNCDPSFWGQAVQYDYQFYNL